VIDIVEVLSFMEWILKQISYYTTIITRVMRKYRFKRGYKATPERLEEMIVKYFGNFEKDGDVYVIRYKAIEELRLWFDGKFLCAESKTNPRVDDRVAIETLRTYNKFLEELTGYTAKERQKMMKKEVEG